MSTETNNDSFITNMLATIKEIQGELNELKIIKRGIVKKSTKRKPARRSKAKRKTAKRTVKRKPARRSKAKRKTARRRQIPSKPSYLTNLCPDQCDNS